jgi:tetratricopeptide (TPR) repeat protein
MGTRLNRFLLCLAMAVSASAAAAEQASSSSSPAVGQTSPCPGAPLQGFADQSTDTAYLERRGISYALQKDLNRALPYLQRACELAPHNPEYVYALGRVQWESGRVDLATQSFDRALALKPDYVQALLARARLRLKDRTLAKADLDAVNRIASPKDDWRLDLGLAYDAIGEYDTAIHQYDLWIDSHYEDARRPLSLAARCRAQAEADRNLDRALKDCNSALRQLRDYPDLRSNRDIVQQRDNPDVLGSRGLVWLRRGDFDHALDDYDAALAGHPKVAEYLFGRGLAKLRKGRPAEGQADIAAASALQPDIAERFAAWGMKP